MKVLYLSRNDGSDTRIRKEVKTLIKHNISVTVVVCAKNNEKKLPIDNPNLSYIFVPNIILNFPAAKFLHMFILALITLKELSFHNYDSIHVLNEEMFIPCILGKLFKINVVLDLFDSIALKFSGRNKYLFKLLLTCTNIAKNNATKILVTDNLRQNLLSKPHLEKSLVLPNYPNRENIPQLELLEPSFQESIDYNNSMFLGGSLSKGRGLETITQALKVNKNLRVICAGWLKDNYAQSFIKHPQVQYFGVLSQKEANQLLMCCKVNIALYEPTNQNNIYASPNKVFDSLCIGKYVFLNSEVKMSKWLKKSKLVKVLTYNSSQQLVDKFDECDNLQHYRMAKKYQRLFTWERFEDQLIKSHKK